METAERKAGLKKYLGPSRTTCVNLEEWLHEDLDKLSKEKSKSKSALIREIVGNFVEREKTSGYVYFVRETANNMVKVGKSKNPEQRVSELKVPYVLEVLQTVRSNNYSVTEKLLHDYYEMKSIPRIGEWFKLDSDELDRIRRLDFPHHILKSIYE